MKYNKLNIMLKKLCVSTSAAFVTGSKQMRKPIFNQK